MSSFFHKAVVAAALPLAFLRPAAFLPNRRRILATADHGDARPELRLYDPDKMLASIRTSAPGVVAHRVLAGPYTQNLHWDAAMGQLIFVQNAILGRGWRLDVLNLDKAVADGRASGPGVRALTLTFMPHDELEGYRPLDAERSLFANSSRKNNLVLGEVKSMTRSESPPAR
jgi:hypothetical protein